MNHGDIFSTIQGQTNLEPDPNCNYIGMQKDYTPVCKIGEIYTNIQDDDSARDCGISLKRVDRRFGPWESVETIDTPTEWKRYRTRELLLEAAHSSWRHRW